jgi:hypothetical protein
VFVRGYLSALCPAFESARTGSARTLPAANGDQPKAPPLTSGASRYGGKPGCATCAAFFIWRCWWGSAWTAIQNLNNLDPSRLLTLWSDGRSDSVSRTGNQPANTDSPQTQYPFQPAQNDDQPLPPPPLATKEAPATPVQSRRHSNVGSPAPRRPHDTRVSATEPATVSPTSGLVLTTNRHPPLVRQSLPLALRYKGSWRLRFRPPVRPRKPGVPARRTKQNSCWNSATTAGGSEGRARQCTRQRPDESQQRSYDFRLGALQGNAWQCARRPYHPGRSPRQHRYLRAPTRHGQPVYPRSRPTLTLGIACVNTLAPQPNSTIMAKLFTSHPRHE